MVFCSVSGQKRFLVLVFSLLCCANPLDVKLPKPTPMKIQTIPLLLVGLLYGHELSSQDIQIDEAMHSYEWRAIGPANMGGRVTDIDGIPGDPSTFYVSGADGGIFKTTNGGVDFTPIFEGQRAYSIGALTIAPSDENVLWVGTGEGDPRNSVGYGWGVYRSVDAGQNWTH